MPFGFELHLCFSSSISVLFSGSPNNIDFWASFCISLLCFLLCRPQLLQLPECEALSPQLSETLCQDSTLLLYSQNIVARQRARVYLKTSLKDQEVWCFLMASAQNIASYILSSIIVDYSRRAGLIPATLSQLKLDIAILFKFLIKKYKWIQSFFVS